MSKKEVLDKFVGKVISRKLLVFLVATLLTLFGKLDSGDWTLIGIAYITMQGVIDVKQLYELHKK